MKEVCVWGRGDGGGGREGEEEVREVGRSEEVGGWEREKKGRGDAFCARET